MKFPPIRRSAIDLVHRMFRFTDEQISVGRELGTLIARNLVTEIQAMGLPATRGIQGGMPPQVGDAVIRGYLVSIEGGSTVKRFVLGFGAGTSDMDTVVEGYIMTTQGLRKLGSGTLSSRGGKTPGMIVPAAVTIASENPVGLIVVGGRKYTERRLVEIPLRVERRRLLTKSLRSSKSGSRIADGFRELT